MKALFLIAFVLVGICRTTFGQLYFPLENYYNTEIERFQLSHDQGYYGAHLSMKPILDTRTFPDSIYFKDSKHYYWITQKLFKENFLIFKGTDFWCGVDPIVDLEIGSDLSSDSSRILYWNTRGIRVQAKFGDKVGFSTVVYENQAVVPDYQGTYFQDHGEYYPKAVGYIQNNGVVPGYARTKSFKTTGYDFAFAQGSFVIMPNKFFNFQFGNGNHFIGDGYRSLLLSDFSVNYPFAKFETNFWKNRIQYTMIYALHQNLYRMSAFTSPEANYEKKLGTYHYLDLAILPNLSLGLFEGAMWRRSDSLGTHAPDPLFLNPLPFVNGALLGTESSGYNAIYGLNFSYFNFNTKLYGQLILDQAGIDGFQIGTKIYDVVIPHLDFRVEYNKVNKNTYLSGEQRYNYSHYNLPLAHPLGAGFQELVFQGNFEYKGFFINEKINYSKRYQNDTLYNGTSILSPKFQGTTDPTAPTFVVMNHFEFGYRFNKRYNLQAVVGYLFRKEDQQDRSQSTNYIYFGVRTRLQNKTLDW